MSYRPTKETKDWEAPPGLGPWREITDQEYEALKASYDGDITRWYERADGYALRDETTRSETETTTRKRRATAGGEER